MTVEASELTFRSPVLVLLGSRRVEKKWRVEKKNKKKLRRTGMSQAVAAAIEGFGAW